MPKVVPLALALLVAIAISPAAQAKEHFTASRSPMIVVISLDAFGATTLQDPATPVPTLRALMKTGTYASAMRPINPTITWPNHTAMVTGVDASRHFVMLNGLATHQRDPAANLTIDFPSSRAALVHAPTLYDLARAAGLTTAEVDWVAIHNAHTIDFPFEENPDPNGTVVREMLASGELQRADLAAFHGGDQPRRDQLYTAAAVHILRQHHPNLLLLHYLTLDSTEHTYGMGTLAGASAIAFLDSQVKQIVDAVREAGDLDRTTFFIVSDHGQITVNTLLRPGVMLRDAGIPSSEAVTLAEGGVAYIYIRANAAGTAQEVEKIKRVFAGKAGVGLIAAPDAYASLGIAPPSENPQAPDLLVFAEPGFSMAEGETGPAMEHLPSPLGSHGYPNTEPLMQQIFIASGNGIRSRGEIGPISVLDLAPTIASLLNLPLRNVQGKALEQILNTRTSPLR